MATVPSPNKFLLEMFHKDYLTSLTERKKWKENRKNLKVGDVVLVSEPNQQRGIWPLGRVVSTHPGQDGRVCAELRVENSEDQ